MSRTFYRVGTNWIAAAGIRVPHSLYPFLALYFLVRLVHYKAGRLRLVLRYNGGHPGLCPRDVTHKGLTRVLHSKVFSYKKSLLFLAKKCSANLILGNNLVARTLPQVRASSKESHVTLSWAIRILLDPAILIISYPYPSRE